MTTCRERELTLDHIHIFWPHKDMECLLEWGINSMPGPPPRHARRYTPFIVPIYLTRWILKDDYDGQMIFWDLVRLNFPEICLTGEKNSGKNLTQETCPDRGSYPFPLCDRRACYRLPRSGGHHYMMPSQNIKILISCNYCIFYSIIKS